MPVDTEVYARLLDRARSDLDGAGLYKVSSLVGKGVQAATDVAQKMRAPAAQGAGLADALVGSGVDKNLIAGLDGAALESLGQQFSHLQRQGLSSDDAMRYVTTTLNRKQNPNPYFANNPMLEHAAQRSGQHTGYFDDTQFLGNMDTQISSAQRSQADEILGAAPTPQRSGAQPPPIPGSQAQRPAARQTPLDPGAQPPPEAPKGQGGGTGMLLPGLAVGGVGAGAVGAGMMDQQKQEAEKSRNLAFGAGLVGGTVAPKLLSGIGNLVSGGPQRQNTPGGMA